MRKLQLIFLSTLALAFTLSLIACSPSEKETDEQTQTDEYTQNNDQSLDEPTHEELMAADGWRKGKLHIEIDIQQDGGTDESGVKSAWTSILKAVSEADVMLAEDLRPYVTEGPLPDTEALQYEPFSLIDLDAKTVQSSEVLDKATWSVSSDEITGSNEGEFKGVVDRVYLQSLHPSLFGPGYEASLKLNITGQLKTREVLSAKGQAPVTTEKDKEVTEEIVYYLHPVPNADKLNDYEYLPEGIDDSLKESLTKQNLEMLSLLNELNKDAQPVQGQIRAGMISEATEDSLTLTYEYTGNKEVGHAAMMGVTAGMAKNNRVKITIKLTANP